MRSLIRATKSGDFDPLLTQIRKHIPAVIVVPGAGTLKGVQFRRREGRGGNRQGDGLVESLLAGKADTAILSLIHMFVTKSPAAL